MIEVKNLTKCYGAHCAVDHISFEVHEGEILGFEVQTTSYGALPVDEVKKVIDGLNDAIEVVDILTKAFVKS